MYVLFVEGGEGIGGGLVVGMTPGEVGTRGEGWGMEANPNSCHCYPPHFFAYAIRCVAATRSC